MNPVKEDQCVFVTYEGEMTLVEFMATRYEANELPSVRRWNRMVVNIAELQSTPIPRRTLRLRAG